MKKLNIKSLPYWLVIVVLGVTAAAGTALALSGSFPIGIETCNDCNFDVAGESGEESLGVANTRFPNGLNITGSGEIAVDGTVIIDGSRNVTALSASVINGSSTSTVAVGSSAIGVNAGKLCLWNGSEYTVLNFASGTTTPSYATSTACN